MPKYMCPECEAILSRPEPVPSGKKIKCPKCEFIFLAKALPDDDEEEAAVTNKKSSAAGPPAPKKEEAKAKHADDEEDEGGTYGVIKEEKANAEPAVKFEDLRKKFPKSKRGPAMALTVTPSNFMMLLGMGEALFALGAIMRFLWPFIFTDTPPKGNKATNYVLYICGWVAIFCIDAVICYGASKMHTLESLQWSWVATVLTIAFIPALGWLVGGMGVAVLQKEEVKDGFIETEERASELKNMHGTSQ